MGRRQIAARLGGLDTVYIETEWKRQSADGRLTVTDYYLLIAFLISLFMSGICCVIIITHADQEFIAVDGRGVRVSNRSLLHYNISACLGAQVAEMLFCWLV